MLKKLPALFITSLVFLTACADQTVETEESAPQSTEMSTEESLSDERVDEVSLLDDDELFPISAEEVFYYADQPEVAGYLALPEGEGPFPALILIHEWWGLNDDMRQKAEEFAMQGYVALAVDLYEGEFAATPDEAGALAGQVRENTEGAFSNLSAAMDYLKSLDQVDAGRLASVGWCFGGQWSYEMAKNDLGTDVSIMYYGRFHPEDDLSMMKSLILGHFGEDDASISVDDVKEFQVTLGEQDDRHEIYIYENAGHAFANEDSDAYVEEAAEEAWQRSLDFLGEYL